MKHVTQMLRQADPLNEDERQLEEARDEIRRTVVAAASTAPRRAHSRVSRRRLVLGAAGALAISLTVVGMLVGVGERGALQAAVRFEVRLAEEQPIPGFIVARVDASGRMIYLQPRLIVTNDDIAQSWMTPVGPDRFEISVRFLQDGAERMRRATAAHLGRPMAILIDGKVVAAPVVRSAIGDSAVITGDFTQREAERIVNGISVP